MVNRYVAGGLAISSAVSLYTAWSIPQGGVERHWITPPVVGEEAIPRPAQGVFPAREDEHAPLAVAAGAAAPRADGLAMVRPSFAEPEPPGAAIVHLAPIATPEAGRLKVILDRHPWLEPLGAGQLSRLLSEGEIETRGVWGACSKLGLHERCVSVCKLSGPGCKPE
ncbi:MAG: hypothetical protein HY553_14775 [Elusimicrobia bacterium]|nr:hypothetical protein [Elusimicrobiota bacterium]